LAVGSDLAGAAGATLAFAGVEVRDVGVGVAVCNPLLVTALLAAAFAGAETGGLVSTFFVSGLVSGFLAAGAAAMVFDLTSSCFFVGAFAAGAFEPADFTAGADFATGLLVAAAFTGAGAFTGADLDDVVLVAAVLATATVLADLAFLGAALAVLLSETVALATALVAEDFLTLMVCATEAAARAFAEEAATADALATGALVALDFLTLDSAPLRTVFRDDCMVEGILGYSLRHPALETGQAAIHPSVNSSETSARTRQGRWPLGRSDVLSSTPQKRPRAPLRGRTDMGKMTPS
jgi:hypothetical protein